MAILFEMSEEYKEFLENEYNIAFEGTMKEIKNIKKDTGKQYKKWKQSAKVYLKNNDYTRCINACEKAKKKLDEIEKESKKVSDPDFIDYLKRYLLWSLITPYLTVINIATSAIQVKHAKEAFNKWIKKEREKIDEILTAAKEMK